MSEYELHEYLYKLADDLKKENTARLDNLMRSTKAQGRYNYTREKDSENTRFYETIFMADPAENRESHYANHRNPKWGPARYDLRTYEAEPAAASSDTDRPTFYRKCLLSDLSEALCSEIKQHCILKEFVGCLLDRAEDNQITVYEKGFTEEGVTPVFSQSISFKEDSPHHKELNDLWAKAIPTKFKVSRRTPFLKLNGKEVSLDLGKRRLSKVAYKSNSESVMKQAYVKDSLGLDVNYSFLKEIQNARGHYEK